MDEPEGDRRARLPGAKLGAPGPPAALPRRFVSRHACRRDRRGAVGNLLARRARPSPGRQPLGRRSQRLGRQLPRVQHPDAGRLHREHAGDRGRVRGGGARRDGRHQLLGRRHGDRPGERRDDRDGSQRLRSRRRAGDLCRQLAGRLRVRQHRLARDGARRDHGRRLVQRARLHTVGDGAGRTGALGAARHAVPNDAAGTSFPRLGHARPDGRRHRLGPRHGRAAGRPPALRRLAPERARHDASARLDPRDDRPRLSRRLRNRHEGDSRAARRRRGHDPRRQPAGRAHVAPPRHPRGHDRGPRRRPAAGLPRLGRGQRGSPLLVRQAPASPGPGRDDDVLLLGRADRVRALAEARRLGARRGDPLLDAAGIRESAVRPVRRDEHVGAARRGCGRAPPAAPPRLDDASGALGTRLDGRAGLGGHGEDDGGIRPPRGGRDHRHPTGGRSAGLHDPERALVRRPQRQPRCCDPPADARGDRRRRRLRDVDGRGSPAVGEHRGVPRSSRADLARPGRPGAPARRRDRERHRSGGRQLRVPRPTPRRCHEAHPLRVLRHAARARRHDPQARCAGSRTGRPRTVPHVSTRTAGRPRPSATRRASRDRR